MYGWGAANPEAARDVLDWVPAIDKAMITEVQTSLRDDGVMSVFLGPFFGVPYKIYAVEAAGTEIGLAEFLAISVPARLLRFLVLTLVAWVISAALAGRLNSRMRIGLLAGVWGTFYVAYFAIVGL